MDTGELRKQHADILDQIGVIRALLEMPSSARGALDIGQRLDVLAATLALHLSLEDRDFYPIFLLSEDDKIRTRAERFFIEMGHLRRDFGTFTDLWRSSSAIQSRFVEFATDAHRIFSLIENRIQEENDRLFPLWETPPSESPLLGNKHVTLLRQQA